MSLNSFRFRGLHDIIPEMVGPFDRKPHRRGLQPEHVDIVLPLPNIIKVLLVTDRGCGVEPDHGLYGDTMEVVKGRRDRR